MVEILSQRTLLSGVTALAAETHAPTGIRLAGNTVKENQPVGAKVGELSGVDSDIGDTFAFKLVAGDGGVDNDSFKISGNQLLASKSFDFEAKSIYSIRVDVVDSQGHHFQKAFQIKIVNVNEGPLVDKFAAPVVYKEKAPPVPIAGDAELKDVDSPNFEGGKLAVRISANASPGDELSIRNDAAGPGHVGLDGDKVISGGVVIGNWSGGKQGSPLVITFNADATPERVRDLLRAVSFSNKSPNPNVAPRTIEVKIGDGDGAVTLISKQVGVQAVNDPPVISPLGPPLNYVKGAPPIPVTLEATVDDVDSPNFAGGKLKVGVLENFSPSDRIEIRNQEPGPGSVATKDGNVTFGGVVIGTVVGGDGANPLVITFNERADKVVVQAVLRDITFRTSADTTSTAPRTIGAVLEDGDGGTSLISKRTINIVTPPPT